jgi:hypothetical protein
VAHRKTLRGKVQIASQPKKPTTGHNEKPEETRAIRWGETFGKGTEVIRLPDTEDHASLGGPPEFGCVTRLDEFSRRQRHEQTPGRAVPQGERGRLCGDGSTADGDRCRPTVANDLLDALEAQQ